ncbi:helix-turn-helix domain-containing protein [Clostridium sp. YIM B02500]|uniref:helix-turn-helix transcriptional regulator n=1 Tax=Clostridium sp. YIM B02500 TaxID=2910681 RepID=UPI001EEF2894|nr:helix-turn-helix domain-containing protein [Clostridium sp. YIM B02500]
MSKLLTIAELSKITGLGVTTIRRRVAAGTLPYTRANANSGKLLFNEELVQTVLHNEAYSHLKGCDMGDMIDTKEPETQNTSYLGSLFKPSDPWEAEAERDVNFGYKPRNVVKSASFTK